jgi:hypothetical protein
MREKMEILDTLCLTLKAGTYRFADSRLAFHIEYYTHCGQTQLIWHVVRQSDTRYVLRGGAIELPVQVAWELYWDYAKATTVTKVVLMGENIVTTIKVAGDDVSVTWVTPEEEK